MIIVGPFSDEDWHSLSPALRLLTGPANSGNRPDTSLIPWNTTNLPSLLPWHLPSFPVLLSIIFTPLSSPYHGKPTHMMLYISNKNITDSQWTARLYDTQPGVKKEQGQDHSDYFSQQSRILLTLPTYISPLIISSTYLGWVMWEVYGFVAWNNHLVPVLF